MQKIQFNVLKSSKFNRRGKLSFFNDKEIETPICWFGLSTGESKDFQLDVFKKSNIEAFMSNAYDLYYNDTGRIRENLINELRNLNLKHKMDSGGFQQMKMLSFQKNKNHSLTPELVLKKQIDVGCECGVQLDLPFGPNLNSDLKKKMLEKTLKNLEELIKIIDFYDLDFSFLPVIHIDSKDFNLFDYGLRKIEDILGEKPKVIGIGSLVPLVRKIKGSKSNGIKSFLYILSILRKRLPNCFIHAFGIGGTMAYLAILAGIDSYDSNGWIQKSAYGVIQLPGISDRFLQKESHNRPYLIKNRKRRNSKKPINEINIFMNCKCDACNDFYKKNWTKKDWKLKQKAFIGREKKPRLLRAIHNVSLFQNEILEIRNAIQKDNLLNFIKDRLKFSIYYKYIEFIEELKNNEIENLKNFDEVINNN